MPTHDAERYSYLRATCEVRPTPQLERYLAIARTIGNATFGFKDSTVLRRPNTIDEELEVGFIPEYEGVGVPHVNVYSPKKLRFDLFERRDVPSDEFNDLVSTVWSRMRKEYVTANRPARRAPSGRKVEARRRNPLPKHLRSIEEAHGFTAGDFSVELTSVGETTKKDYETSGKEYGLMVDPTSEAGQVLCEKAELLIDSMKRIKITRPLVENFVPDTDPLAMPFIQVPMGTQPQHEEFVERMTQEIPPNGFRLDVLQVEWVPMIRSTES